MCIDLLSTSEEWISVGVLVFCVVILCYVEYRTLETKQLVSAMKTSNLTQYFFVSLFYYFAKCEMFQSCIQCLPYCAIIIIVFCILP
jgi:hypothetical protein